MPNAVCLDPLWVWEKRSEVKGALDLALWGAWGPAHRGCSWRSYIISAERWGGQKPWEHWQQEKAENLFNRLGWKQVTGRPSFTLTGPWSFSFNKVNNHPCFKYEKGESCGFTHLSRFSLTTAGFVLSSYCKYFRGFTYRPRTVLSTGVNSTSGSQGACSLVWGGD